MQPLDKELDIALEAWRTGTSSLGEIRALAAELGNRHHVQGTDALVELLNHEDAIVRYNAAISLGFELKHKPATSGLLEILSGDVDGDTRDAAAGALANLWLNSADPQVLRALGEAALNDQDDGVRRSAYRALIIVSGVTAEQHLKLLQSDRAPVDEARVKNILDEKTRDPR